MATTSGARKSLGPADRFEPMLAETAAEPFDSPDKLFEIKWDGVRAIAVIEYGTVRLHTRGMKDISAPYADVCEALLKAFHGENVVLDGELIAPDDDGIPRLQRVMQRWHQGMLVRKRVPVSFEVFDILHRDGRSLLREPLHLRKEQLAECIEQNPLVRVSHYEEGEGVALFEAARDLGLGGIVAKDRLSRYQPGKRSPHWLEVKHSRSANLVVGGYTFGGGARGELFGGLLLGAYVGNKLRYVGSVGGGFSHDDLAVTYASIIRMHTEACPFEVAPVVERFSFWCRPGLVVQVNYGEFTGQQLRFPVFSALRPDVAPVDCSLDLI